MKPLLLHGNNAASSRDKLDELRSGHSADNIILDGKTVSWETLAQHLETSGLFATDQLLIVENLSQNKALAGKIIAGKDIRPVVFWEGKKLTRNQIKTVYGQIANLTILEFKEDPIVFKFLDVLAPGEQALFLPFWQKYRQTSEPEIILTMLARQVRLLLAAKEGEDPQFEEWKNLASWQKSKLYSLAKKFPQEKLRQLQNDLLEADFRFKSGAVPIDLADSIELLLLSL